MKTRWIVALVVVVLALFAIHPRHRSVDDAPTSATPNPTITTPASSTPAAAPDAVAANAPPPANQTRPAEVPPPSRPSAATPPAATPQQPGGATVAAVRDEIENVQFALRDYRTAVGENPIGNNAEITKALIGDNIKQVKIPIPPGSSVNGNGEMCDRWGTPYFFHQLSGKQMEIRSAGPDREMWTGDDVAAK